MSIDATERRIHGVLMTILAGLDAVPWASLKHAYGPATDVPDLLRALADPEAATLDIARAARSQGKTVFEHVTWILYGNVFHQGTVWQASPHAIPFFYELLRDGRPDPALRQFLAEYLHHLAYGYPDDLFPRLIDPDVYFAVEHSAEDGADPYSDASLATCARACFLAVEKELPTVAALVNDSDEATAISSIALVAGFPRRAALSCEALGRVLAGGRSEANAMRLAAALVALAQLGAPNAHAEAEAHVRSADRRLAIHAACASVLANANVASMDAIAVLVAPREDLEELPSPFAGTVGALVSRALVQLPPQHAETAARAISASLASAKPLTNLASTAALLDLVFSHPPAPDKASGLSPIQRAALEAIQEHGAFSMGDGTFANYSLLLSEWRLPSDREALRTWLAGSAVKRPASLPFRTS